MSHHMSIKTRVVQVDPDRPDLNVLAAAASIIRKGGLVAFTTETVYGLGADATNSEAVTKIFAAKGRPSKNPLIVHANDSIMARQCVAAWSDDAEKLANHFWPGPLTLILPRSASIPDIVTAGGPTVGVRVPGLALPRYLIMLAQVPIAAPSANRSNGVSPTLASHVYRDLDGRVEMILDGGPCRVGLESTVLDLSRETPRLLRPGMLSRTQLQGVIGRPINLGPGVDDEVAQPSSPGQMTLHYAPRTCTQRLDLDSLDPGLDDHCKGKRFAIMNLGHPPHLIENKGELRISYEGPDAAAHDLYARLRLWDAAGLDLILIVMPPDVEDWAAIRDRICRASGMSHFDRAEAR